MPNIAVVYHSGFGHTEVLAHEVAVGVAAAGGTPYVHKIEGLTADFAPILDALVSADAVVFGTPTYMGTVSAPFKAFMDASVKPWFGQAWKDKLAAGFTNSGGASGDKLNTLTTLAVFAAQHGMVWVPPALMADPAHPETLNRLGSYLGAMAQSANASPEETPPPSDRATARALGERIAAAAVRWGTSPA